MLGLVCVKRVVDATVAIRVARNHLGVDLSNVKMAMNPFCEIAVEEGVLMKERKALKELVAVSIGPEKAQDTLRQALAMGADRAILLKTDMRTDTDLQPLAVAKLLKLIALRENAKLVLLGKQSIDDDFNQTSQLLAGLLGWGQATQASEVTFDSNGSSLKVKQEVDDGLQLVQVDVPAVISCDLRLNEPRYATLPNLMKAKKKLLETINADSLGVDLNPRLEVLSVDEPEKRKAGVIVDTVDELLHRLRTEKKLDI